MSHTSQGMLNSYISETKTSAWDTHSILLFHSLNPLMDKCPMALQLQQIGMEFFLLERSLRVIHKPFSYSISNRHGNFHSNYNVQAQFGFISGKSTVQSYMFYPILEGSLY